MSVRHLVVPVAGILFLTACEGSVSKATWDKMNSNCDAYKADMEVDLSGELPVFTVNTDTWAAALADDDRWRDVYVGFQVDGGTAVWGETKWPAPAVSTITWGSAPADWTAYEVEKPESGTEYTVQVELGPIENGGVFRSCYLAQSTFTAP